MIEETYEESEKWVTDTLLDLVNKGFVEIVRDEEGVAWFKAKQYFEQVDFINESCTIYLVSVAPN